jgi:hypothetical protein
MLNIVTDAPLSGPRITKTEQVSANRFHNETMVTEIADLAPVHEWIAEAYRLSQ